LPKLLTDRLSQLPVSEIIDFGSHFHECIERANDGRLWAAASVIMRGCSDDSFDYFLGWLIAQGRPVFEAAFADPDSLAGVESAGGWGKSPQLEEILSVDVDACRERTGLSDSEARAGGALVPARGIATSCACHVLN
jgi:hypothetical protein